MTKVGGSVGAGDGVRSVLNALAVLETLAARQPIGVSELAREVELPKSSVQRTLRTLDQAGWAEPDGSAGVRWRLTRKVFRVGLSGSIVKTLPEGARRHLTTLRDTYRETVHLTVADGDHVIVIARVDGTNSLRTFLEVGTQAPILNSAGGRAILSRMPPEVTEELLAQPVQAHTPATITDGQAIRDQVATARARGYATNEAEWRNDIAAVAAPIVAPDGEVFGAVSLSMPSSRYQTLDIPAVGADVAAICAQIAASVHYRL
ncbi:IclR family transcriptional regulator [Ornithinimicrobium cavernae]|uniref:IclR family transcriptional regulator n=1 Tax=Ornithinimicrobium cavernae TaxID=2666047 RepID=UPI000D686464|nr:IclR family transcriptional regulator [Ornithinimicrobium cavernae]